MVGNVAILGRGGGGESRGITGASLVRFFRWSLGRKAVDGLRFLAKEGEFWLDAVLHALMCLPKSVSDGGYQSGTFAAAIFGQHELELRPMSGER